MYFLTSTGTFTNIISGITEIVTGAISWMSSFVTAITDNPLILFFVLMSCSLFGIHILKSLMNR